MTFFPVRKEIIRGALSIFAGFALWEILARALLENELLIPPPSSVASTFWRLLTSGELNKHFAATATEFIYGFAAACLVGVVLGYLMARPEIKTGAYLKGKTIGVSTLTGGTTLMIEEVLEKAYKLKEGEYKYLVVGTSPERYAALKGGSVQATFMGAPFNFRAAREGFNKLITFHEVLGPIQFTVDFAHQDYVKSHRDEIIRYLKSTIEATAWLYDRKNKEEALAIHMKALKTTRDAAEQDYKFMVEDFKPFTRGGAVVKAAWDKTMELRAKEGHYKGKKVPAMTDYVDSSLIEEAQKLAGFKP